ncbi:hypothetical protein E2562_029004 [Oryza meyeriana var. granulata]|uniref:BZIP domain-containing protein n=1 Tax=Oryza meyeriana var. granulata TaxID=110450 RepID=A0A6G1E413_9ORYZ|nr:hypothetical protein E2562_029004 [Oryza meyeriana var. granulata]
MASSRVMASSSPSHTASDLARFAAGRPPGGGGGSAGLGSMNVEEILRGIYADMPTPAFPVGGDRPMSPIPAPDIAAAPRTAEEVWKEITGGGGAGAGAGGVVVAPAAPAVVATGGGAGTGAEMTLEDFLAREGAVKDDEAVVTGPSASAAEGQVVMGFLNGAEGAGGVTGGRSRKRQLMDPMDRAAMQRQKRMIKNRESAARSRERKQAYIAELESLVTQLEEENAKMFKEQVLLRHFSCGGLRLETEHGDLCLGN